MKTEPYSHEGMKGSILDATNSTDRSEESLFQMNFFKNLEPEKSLFQMNFFKNWNKNLQTIPAWRHTCQ